MPSGTPSAFERLTLRSVQAVLGYALGVLLVLAGVFLQWGLPVALIVGGVVTALSFLLLAETDDREARR